MACWTWFWMSFMICLLLGFWPAFAAFFMVIPPLFIEVLYGVAQDRGGVLVQAIPTSLDDPKPQVCGLRRLDHPRALELDMLAAEILEHPRAAAKEHRHECLFWCSTSHLPGDRLPYLPAWHDVPFAERAPSGYGANARRRRDTASVLLILVAAERGCRPGRVGSPRCPTGSGKALRGTSPLGP